MPDPAPRPALSYDVVDVFAEGPFSGNQLAVVHGAGELSTAQCHALAREFNLSETTFPVPSRADSYAVRIFTPGGEIPFAGHPTLGTAWVLRTRGELSGTDAVQHCPLGEVPVSFRSDGLVSLTAAPRALAGPLEPSVVEALLAAVGLGPGDLAGEAHVASAGLPFAFLPVAEGALARAMPPSRPLESYVDLTGPAGGITPDGVDLYAVSGAAPDLTVRSRVFVPGLAVPEDPATGSAAAGLGVVLAATGRLGDGGFYTITQGVEMGRPSTLVGRVEVTDGRAVACHVAGGVHPVASGTIAVPAAEG